MTYEIWDMASGNRVSAYDTWEGVVAEIQEDAAMFEPDSRELRSLALISRDEDGTISHMGEGAALINLVHAPVLTL